jgi:GNAT superfamily N-acetyltransferase
MIERLKPEQLHLCIEGGRLFFEEGKMPGGFDATVFLTTFTDLIESGRGMVLASFELQGDKKVITGALGAVLAPSPFNETVSAIELFWYVLPDHRGHGIKLLRAFEAWAAERGADFICMIHLQKLQPEALGQLYLRLGYRLIESNYLKAL